MRDLPPTGDAGPQSALAVPGPFAGGGSLGTLTRVELMNGVAEARSCVTSQDHAKKTVVL